jgi:DNA-directed RNA polymerase II subunit RPB9
MECGENEAVYFQSQQRTASTGMVSHHSYVRRKTANQRQALYYVCCGCGNVTRPSDMK